MNRPARSRYSSATINRITFVPTGDVQIPVPVLAPGDFRKMHSVNATLPVLDRIEFMATTGMVNFIEGVVGSNVIDSQELFSIPTSFDAGVEMMTLDELSQALAFSLALVWRKNGLALAVRRGGQERIIGFDEIR